MKIQHGYKTTFTNITNYNKVCSKVKRCEWVECRDWLAVDNERNETPNETLSSIMDRSDRPLFTLICRGYGIESLQGKVDGYDELLFPL